jgi:hypothetical protein
MVRRKQLKEHPPIKKAHYNTALQRAAWYKFSGNTGTEFFTEIVENRAKEEF